MMHHHGVRDQSSCAFDGGTERTGESSVVYLSLLRCTNIGGRLFKEEWEATLVATAINRLGLRSGGRVAVSNSAATVCKHT